MNSQVVKSLVLWFHTSIKRSGNLRLPSPLVRLRRTARTRLRWFLSSAAFYGVGKQRVKRASETMGFRGAPEEGHLRRARQSSYLPETKVDWDKFWFRAPIKAALLLGILVSSSSAHAQLIINEIMYDLESADDGREWVEIWNASQATVEIVGGSKESSWRFFDGQNHLLNEPDGSGWHITPNELFIIADDRTKFLAEHSGLSKLVIDSSFSLKNSTATLELIDGSGKIVNEVSYRSDIGANGNGRTLERVANGVWRESQSVGGSPGQPNVMGSDTNEGPLPAGLGTDTGKSFAPTTTTSQETTRLKEALHALPRIIINELLPYPDAGEEEWIELKNDSGNFQDLEHWRLKITEQDWVFPAGSSIQASGFLLIPQYTSGLAIPNDGATVELKNPHGALVFRIAFFAQAPRGAAFARYQDDTWQWSIPTPGKENVFPREERSQLKTQSGKAEATTATKTGPVTPQDARRQEARAPASILLTTEKPTTILFAAPVALALFLAGAAVLIYRRLLH